MKSLITVCLISFISTIVLGLISLPLLKKLKAGQTVLGYVNEHKHKNGTPTMGGLFFILPAVVVYIIFGQGRISNVAAVIGLAFMIVGFIDDFIKIKLKRNEGLKAYQKILFQLSIAVIAGVYCFYNGITVFHIPFTDKNLDLGYFSIPLIAVIFIAITNCVNLTDGLDGLAGGVSAVYFLAISLLIGLQSHVLGHLYLKPDEYFSLQTLSISLLGGLMGFLVFNVNKARVFMGDTGSLALGGFIGAVSIFSSNSFFIPIIGIMFVLSGISVIVQVAYFKRTKKRVFLMAPLHHHFQLKGYSETQIAYCYAIVTAIASALSLLPYL